MSKEMSLSLRLNMILICKKYSESINLNYQTDMCRLLKKDLNEMDMNKIAVFCGSSTGNNDIYIEHAETLGKELANNDKTLVYGGAQVGCMGALFVHLYH